MSHFLLFIPGARGASSKVLEDVGLADFAAGAEFASANAPRDLLPAGVASSGTICAWRKPGAVMPMGFVPAEQDWVPAAASDGLAAARYLVGLTKNAPPRPPELLRPYPYQGQDFPLGDGHQWLFPEYRELPRDILLNDDGTFKFEVQRQFHAFSLDCLRWSADLSRAHKDGETAEARFSYTRIFVFLVQALRLNYRMLPEVASHLRLFNTANVVAPLLQTVASIGPAKQVAR
jgi:hypothetical protein